MAAPFDVAALPATRERLRARVRANGTVEAIYRPTIGAHALGSEGFATGYDGARHHRRLRGFRPTEAAVNTLLAMAGPRLRARSRDLSRNNPYVKKAKRAFVSQLIGTGITSTPLMGDDAAKAKLLEVHSDWADECDEEAEADEFGLQALAAGQLFEAGECFVLMSTVPPGESESGIPLRLRILESEMCPTEMTMIGPNGNPIKMGVEFDKNRPTRRVAYWFWKVHPGEAILPTEQQGYVRVPAEDVIHLFERLRPGQIRGVSWIAAAIVRAFLIDQYEDAELDRKKVAALFAGFITTPSPEDTELFRAIHKLGDDGREDSDIAELSPGTMQTLGLGEDIKFSTPADVGPNFEAFIYRALLALCAALDIPYASVTGDYSKANYSSLRAAQLDLRRSLEQLQHTVIAFKLCRGIWRRFVKEAVLAKVVPIEIGAFLRTPAPFLRATFSPPKFEWVSPKDDENAERSAVRDGFKSRSSVIRSLGEDPDRVYAEIAADNAIADRLGLVFDTDPRRTDMRGSAPPPDLTAPVADPNAVEEADNTVNETEDEKDEAA